jgi:hypothetical protein
MSIENSKIWVDQCDYLTLPNLSWKMTFRSLSFWRNLATFYLPRFYIRFQCSTVQYTLHKSLVFFNSSHPSFLIHSFFLTVLRMRVLSEKNLSCMRLMFEQTGCHVWESWMKRQPAMFESTVWKDNLSGMRVMYESHVWKDNMSYMKSQPVMYESLAGKDILSWMRVMYEKSTCHIWKDNLSCMRVLYEKTFCLEWESCRKRHPVMDESHVWKVNLSCMRVLYEKSVCQVWDSCMKRQPVMYETLYAVRTLKEREICSFMPAYV